MKTIRHFYAFTFVLAAVLSTSARAQDITLLEPGKAITRTAKRQQVDTYQLTLTAGQFIRVLVEQNEVDVSVDLVTPDNKSAQVVNIHRFFEQESLSWEVATSGDYKIVIRTLAAFFDSNGTYQATLTIKSAASTQDKQRIVAERLMMELRQSNPARLSLEQRQEKYQEALRIWRELGDKQAEAHTHDAMAGTYSFEKKYDEARASLKQAIALKEAMQDRLGKVISLSNYGLYSRFERNTSLHRTNDRGQQLMKLDEEAQLQALALSRELKHRGLERFVLEAITGTYSSLELYEKAIVVLEQGLMIDRERKDRGREAIALRGLGLYSYRIKREDKARQYYEESLTISRELKDRAGEAQTLRSLATESDLAGRSEIALRHHESALEIFRELKDRRNEAFSLERIGFFHNRNGRYEKALPFYEQALAVYRELKDQQGINTNHPMVSFMAGRIGRFDHAEQVYEEWLNSFRAAKDRAGEASALHRFANFNKSWNRFEKALQYHFMALKLFQELKNRNSEAATLREISVNNAMLGKLEVTLEYQEKALAVWRETKNEAGLGQELSNVAYTYIRLSRFEKGLEYAQESLNLGRKIKSPLIEAIALVNVGDAIQGMGNYQNALENYQQALTIFNGRRDSRGIADSYWGLGQIYYKLGQNEKSIESYELSLANLRKVQSRQEEALILAEYSDVLRAQGQLDKSLEANLLALRIAREIKAREPEATALKGLFVDLKTRNQPQLAIFFGKQSVNVYQDMRSGLRAIDQESQRSFLKSKEQTYRELADLLIAQGRLPEAEQVIRMLKEEEFFEYVRRDKDNSPKGEKAALTPEEAAIEKRYREIADQLTVIGTQRSDLLAKEVRTSDDEKLLAKLEADLTVANQAFQKFLDGLATEMAQRKGGDAQFVKVREAQGLMEDLRDLGKGTVALYTLVGENKFRMILTTPDVQKAYEVPIKGADLNRKVLAFRAVLQNPKLDPRPAAEELYKILFAPLAKDLEQMKAKTLMWSLDGVLRYVPIAALYDGKQYLVERFQHVMFTNESKARMKDAVSKNWHALGLGVTKSFGEKIPALPAVAEEMRSIINDSGTGKGVLPGTIKLDEQFTQEAMMTGLRARPPVVHVASHFQFQPGNETDSKLLLGDGSFLSLAQIKAMPTPFGGVELLTLSACNTATSGSGANGKEVEGFGMLAQQKGAKAVVASLWPVADRTTRLLMEEFYRGREAHKLTKGEALRQAQGKLLRGELTKQAGEALASRNITHETPATTAPPFTPDKQRPHAHPYYWAPFILIGNWK